MSIDIRLPNINGKTESEQLAQIRSYLYQFAGQLQWALDTVENKSISSNVVVQNNSGASSAKEEDPVSNFNELKALIIKSADIVNAYYDEITKLADQNGLYVAQSDYGTFVEQTKTTLYAEDTGLTQKVSDVQTLTGNLSGRVDKIETDGRIFSGVIKHAASGEDIVGIEIGQTTVVNGKETFDKYAQFTADSLSFFDSNGIKVAYISDQKLVITEAYVKGNLQVGGFILDTSVGIALRWVGRYS